MQLVPGPAFSWESQAEQYSFRGEPGISLERHSLGELGALVTIDCLLSRDDKGLLVGILNHYPESNQHEQAGNFNIWIEPDHQRQGIATALLKDAMTRWADIKLDQQNYTFDGLKWITGLIEKGDVEWD